MVKDPETYGWVNTASEGFMHIEGSLE